MEFHLGLCVKTRKRNFMNKEDKGCLTVSFISGKPYNTKSDVWAIGCVLYEMAALKRAFEAPTLPALILKIMRGVTPPLPAQYSPGARQLLVSLLALEPARRPSIPEIMSHHWLAPYIFRHSSAYQLSRRSLTFIPI